VRVEQIGDATLYLGDCLEILPTLGKVDAVVTDPPFNAGKDFDNDSMTDEKWICFCQSVANRCADIGPENVLIEVGKNDSGMRGAFGKNFTFKWTIALNYTNAMRQGAVGFSNWGEVLWYGGKCHRRYMDRIDAPLENTIKDFSHPSPKNVAHYSKLIEMFSDSGATILDPFMGSGTTGVACAGLGRKFIGIEIEPKYFDIACQRIKREYDQLKLFPPDAPKAKAKQEELDI